MNRRSEAARPGGPPAYRVLAVDTTTPGGSAALLDDGRLMGEIGVESAATHSTRLLAAIDILLKSQSWRLGDLAGFAVSPGPGSFTGLRIGLSTIQAFALAAARPVALVSSLLALAWKHRDAPETLIAPMLDAKRGEIYAALYERRDGRLAPVAAEGAYAPEEFIAALPARRTVLCAGSGVLLCRRRLESLRRGRVRFSERSTFIAAEIGILGTARLKAGKGAAAEAVEPLYYRKSQAEEGR